MNIDYNEFWINNNSHPSHPSVRMRNTLIIDALSKLRFASLIDAGCGDGFLIRLIQNHFSNVEYTGTDISQLIVDADNKKYQNVHFYQGDISSYSFKCVKQFDVVVCSEVIEHVRNWEQAVENLVLLAKNGGYVIVTTQSGKRHISDIKIGHVQHFELHELEKVLQEKNCKIISSFKKGYPFYNLQKKTYDMFGNFAENMQKGDMGTSLFGKVIFHVAYFLFMVTPKSRKFGPQIFILAQKNH